MIRDTGRFHVLKWGGGQIVIPKEMAAVLDLKNKDKLYIEYDEGKKALTISKLN